MKVVLNSLWYVFVLISWSAIILGRGSTLWPIFCLWIVLTGVIYYVVKVRYINELRFYELNYRTIAYYLLFYVLFLLVGGMVWLTAYASLKYIGPDVFKGLFPSESIFNTLAVRAILAGAAFNISGWMSVGMHRHYHKLRFTNKIPIVEVMFVIIACLWLGVSSGFIGLFVSVISIFTAPDAVKRFAGHVLSFILRRNINLINVRIENNSDEDLVLETREDYILNILESISTVIIHGGKIHLRFMTVVLLVWILVVLWKVGIAF